MKVGLVFVLAVRTRNPLNGAQGWSRQAAFARTRERALHRRTALWTTRAQMLRAHVSPAVLVPCTVTLRRLSAGRMDDDGLAASCKGVRDGIAEALGVDDGSDVVTWRYEQRRCKRGTGGLEVLIQRRAAA